MQTTHQPPTAHASTVTAPFGALAGTHWIESLRDGTPVLIRPLAAQDRAREEDFIQRLSPAARRLRFLGVFKTASPTLLDQLMKTDDPQAMAFVALAHDDGQLREVGISRYSATDDAQRGECAVTVAEDWQQRGLGALLMRHLIDCARRHGYRQLFSIDAADNEPMRELAHYLGFQRRRDPGDAALVIHTLEL